MKKYIYIFMLVLLWPHDATAQCSDKRDWKRAIWRVPLHFVLSSPVAATSFVIPPIGKKYVNWRIASEKNDVASGKDTPMKASIDLYSQVALVKGALWVYRIKTADDTLPPCTFDIKKKK